MFRRFAMIVICCSATFGLSTGLVCAQAKDAKGGATEQRHVRDMIWVWGNPEMTQPGEHTASTFAQASPARRAALLGVPNIVMAGLGLPEDDAEADRLTREVSSFARLTWEISPDGEGLGPPFVYRKNIGRIGALAGKYPALGAVMLDDMSTQKIDRGFKPEHVRQIRQLLDEHCPKVKLWGVLYTMSLERERIDEFVRELDVINLWTWHAKDIPQMEDNVAVCEKRFPGKPIILGMYLYDYGTGQRMPIESLKRQCATALKLAHAGRIQGMVFLTITNDPDTVGWASGWVKRVGDQRVGAPPGSAEKESDFGSVLPNAEPWPTWIEGPDGTILMSFNDGGKVRIAASDDAGLGWKVVSTIEDEKRVAGGYFTRTADGGFLLVVCNGDGAERSVCWIRSDDGGRTWSKPTLIMKLEGSLHPYGPICIMQDGRWAYCPYAQDGDRGFRALVTWSSDNGKTWGEPVAFSTPADGNAGMTECTIAQLGPRDYLAAIRADEGQNAWDGFYLSRSTDGVNWSPPQSLGEKGRMPLFYRVGGCWALAYRQYDANAGTQHSVIRWSRDGRDWSHKQVIESGVNAGPQLVRVGERLLAFNTRYPARNEMTRHDVEAPCLHAPFDMKFGEGWAFSGGTWSCDDSGLIRPPNKRNLHSRAFCTAAEFGDFTAEFEFNADYRETGSGDAGLILRARDMNHFYLVHFPWCGQQLRAKHFWAAIARVEGDAYLRHVKAAWVPGVPSETDRWFKVRVEARGPRIGVWVDGHRALDVVDNTYSKGFIGFAGYGWYAFRNLRVTGQKLEAGQWDAGAGIPTHTFGVGLSSENMPSGCVAPNGDVLLAAGDKLVRSRDRGRTWSGPEALPVDIVPVTDYGNTMFCTGDGRLIVQTWCSREKPGEGVPEIRISESKDNGASWSTPVESKVAGGWPSQPGKLTPYGPIVEAADGVLLRFLLGGVKDEGATFTDVRTWGSVHCKAFVIRSADGGRSWSAPIELDRPSWCNTARGTIPGSLDLTEPAAVAAGSSVTALIRPIYSPNMWQCRSSDGGASWDAAVRATFPGYAQSMVRTECGAMLCAHRFPLYSINVSHDGGLHWDHGTVVDYPVWGMGCLIEVEPDVVLCICMNAQRNMPLKAQLIRLAPDRIMPVER